MSTRATVPKLTDENKTEFIVVTIYSIGVLNGVLTGIELFIGSNNQLGKHIMECVWVIRSK